MKTLLTFCLLLSLVVPLTAANTNLPQFIPPGLSNSANTNPPAFRAPGAAGAASTNSPRFRTATFTGVDTNAQQFLTAAGITNRTISNAVTRLVYDLKRGNIWTNLIAFYPIVGGTALSTPWNLKDTNAYKITWTYFGTPTGDYVSFSTNGVSSDGLSGYGDTGFIPTNSPFGGTNFHLFANFSGTPTSAKWFMGCVTPNYVGIGTGIGNSRNFAINGPSTPFSTTNNYLFVSRTNDTQLFVRGNTTNTVIASLLYEQPTNRLSLLATTSHPTNVAGFLPAAVTLKNASFGNSLTPGQGDFYIIAVSNFNRALGRN